MKKLKVLHLVPGFFLFLALLLIFIQKSSTSPHLMMKTYGYLRLSEWALLSLSLGLLLNGVVYYRERQRGLGIIFITAALFMGVGVFMDTEFSWFSTAFTIIFYGGFIASIYHVFEKSCAK
ncbi:hypothetical protein TS65_18890 [Aneurinibacillus migulanus]|uniref:Uncharacterized protein n=1 Tax=Aneurinibacillus migulanus TaxID=47500 RepID=A0A0D1V6A8_ANEMI|nr:hypothetical protein TS65_18890 [Aneurinibacillus migulanus]KON95464.1 hypothetical protein AF333_08160 [Aneurinibacillus migulanus]SDJ04769.1 hypothetical protein SAMN04487909_1117 [Aneurinibacillus migulanus]